MELNQMICQIIQASDAIPAGSTRAGESDKLVQKAFSPLQLYMIGRCSQEIG